MLELELSTDDLVSSTNASTHKGSPARNDVRSAEHLDAEADSVSQLSLRAGTSIRSVASSTHSSDAPNQRHSGTQGPRLGSMPGSKLSLETLSSDTVPRSLSRTSMTSTMEDWN